MALSGRVRLFLAQMIPKWVRKCLPKEAGKGNSLRKTLPNNETTQKKKA